MERFIALTQHWWEKRRTHEPAHALVEPAALGARAWPSVSEMFGREAEITQIEGLLAQGKRVIWITGPRLSGRTTLAAHCLAQLCPEQMPVRFVLRPALTARAVLEGITATLPEEPRRGLRVALQDATREIANVASQLGRALERHQVPVLLEDADLVSDPAFSDLVASFSGCLQDSVCFLTASVRPAWASEHPEVQLGSLGTEATLVLAASAGCPGDLLQESPSKVGQLPGILVHASVLAAHGGSEVVREVARGSPEETGRPLLERIFETLDEETRRLLLILCVLPVPMPLAMARRAFRSRTFVTRLDVLVEWRLATVSENLVEIHSAVREVVEARLSSAPGWVATVGRRLAASQKHALWRWRRLRPLDDAGIESAVALAWWAAQHGNWPALLAVGTGTAYWLGQAERRETQEQVLRLCREITRRRRDRPWYAWFSRTLWPLLEIRNKLDDLAQSCQADLADPWISHLWSVRMVALLSLGDVAGRRGDWEEAEARYQESFQLGFNTGDFVVQFTALSNLAEAARQRRDWRAVERLLARRRRVFRRLYPHSKDIDGLLRAAEVARVQGRLQEAEARWAESAASSPQSDQGADLLSLYLSMADLARLRGDSEFADRVAREGLHAARAIGRPDAEVGFLDRLGQTATWRGRLTEAEEFYAEAGRIAQKTGAPDQEAYVCHNLGAVAFLKGPLPEAERLYRNALSLARESEARPLIGFALVNLGWAIHEQGRAEEAEAHYRESWALAHGQHLSDLEAWTLGRLGVLAHERGQQEEAERLLGEAVDLHRKAKGDRGLTEALYDLGVFQLAQGRLQEAERSFQESLEVARRVGCAPHEAGVLWQLGLLHEEAGDLEAADAALKEAAARMRDMELRKAAQVEADAARVNQALQDKAP